MLGIANGKHYRHGGYIHTDSILYVNQHIVIQRRQDRGTRIRTKTNRFVGGRRYHRTENTACTHKAVGILNQRNDIQVDTLQTGSGSHDETVVAGKHHRPACLGIKNTGQTVLHPPRKIFRTFHMKTIIGSSNSQTEVATFSQII